MLTVKIFLWHLPTMDVGIPGTSVCPSVPSLNKQWTLKILVFRILLTCACHLPYLVQHRFDDSSSSVLVIQSFTIFLLTSHDTMVLSNCYIITIEKDVYQSMIRQKLKDDYSRKP